MVVCSYYLRGQCRFGTSCRNEHPPKQFGNMTLNNNKDKVAMPFSTDSITNDLTDGRDKPLWPLSSYAPYKCDPCLLTGLDESLEEMRLKAVLARNSGDAHGYLTLETQKIAAAEATFANARNHVDQAFEQASKQCHLNNDTSMAISPAASSFGNASSFGPFAAPAAGPSAFGSSNSAFGGSGAQQPSAFGGSAFGTSGSSSSAFGASVSTPSAFGGGTGNAFASSSSKPSAFGAPATASGQSAFGNSGSGASAFGGGSASAFGKSSFGSQPAFGQPAFGQSAFGEPTTTTTFASKPAPAPASGFSAFASSGPTAFGSNNNPGGGGFAAFAAKQPSTFGSGFTSGTGAGTSSAFRGNSTGSPFGGGAGSAFGQPAAQQSAFGNTAFGAPASNTSTSSPFTSQSSPFSSAGGVSASAFASNPATTAFGSTPQTQPTSVFGAPTPSVSTSFSSAAQPSQMNAFSSPASQAAPKGPPNFFGDKSGYVPGFCVYDRELPQNYISLIPPEALEAFQGKQFEPGKIPEWIPPLELR